MDSTDTEIRRKRNRESSLQPLIPTSVLDQASQRLFIVSIFILIQSWKIYDLVLLKSEIPATGEVLTLLSNFTFVLKYSVLDGLFLWLLPVLNIQYLSFSPLKTLLLTITLYGFSIFLVSAMALPLLSNVFLPIWRFLLQKKELNIIGESIDRSQVIDMDSHFKGQLTIHYLPDSSAKMNPFHFDQTCLGLDNNHLINMPVEFNTTSGIGYLQVQHTTPDNKIQYLNYTGHSLRRLFKKDYTHLSQYKDYKKSDKRIFYLEYPITKPGMYRIKNVLDNKGNSIRTYKSEFVISDCPLAKFFYPPNFESSNGFKCVTTLEDDSFPLPWVEVFSTTPSSVKLNVKVNGKEFRMMNLTIGQETDHKVSRTDFSWLKTVRLVRNSLQEKILDSKSTFNWGDTSILEFQLLQVKDSFGNVHRYEPLSKDKDVWYKLELRKSPSIGIYDKEKTQELLVGGQKVLYFSNLENFNDDDFPIDVKVKYIGQEEQNITRTFETKADLRNGLTITKPGKYVLSSAKDKYCPCEADKTPVEVELASIPSLDIVADPVSDRCLGTIGYNFDFNFTEGRPPFRVQYRIYSNTSGILKPVYSDTGKLNRELKSFEKSHSFKFKPPNEGSYTIMFTNLKDANYFKDPIALDENKYSYLTYFRQLSQVGFQVHQRTIHTCYGHTTKVPIFFNGNGPFSFEYDFLDVNSRKKLVDMVRVSNVENYAIDTPKELIGKTYDLKLSNAKDRFGCDAIIVDANSPVRVVSRLDIPEVEFSRAGQKLQVVEGSYVDIPLSIKSKIAVNGNDKIEVKYLGPTSKEPTIRRAQLVGSSIRLSDEGTYWLHSFESNGCAGRIGKADQFVTIGYYAKPSLAISASNEMLQHTDDSTIHLKPVCNGCSNEITLKLTGEAPFVVDYEINLPSGKMETHSMNIDTHDITIKLPTRSNGRFEHQFKHVYDRLYTKTRGKPTSLHVPKVIYDINPLPTAQFVPDDHFTQVCENKLSEDSVIAHVPIQFSGAYPFDVLLTLTNEKTGKMHDIRYRNVEDNYITLKTLNFLGLGDYSLKFAKVSDANGCTTHQFKTNDRYLISITEPPTIYKADPATKHYCVGDHVAYNLTGVFPITIFYEYNDKVRRAELYSRFERLASRPGVLNIHGLKDSGINSCAVNYTFDTTKLDELRLEVHEIPTVEVNKGDYLIEDLHEGDQTELIFTFLGEPPFQLTYIRTIDIRKGKKTFRKLVEKETIKDIWQHELVVMASLEGTYEAIEIQDKYCRAVKKVDYIE